MNTLKVKDFRREQFEAMMREKHPFVQIHAVRSRSGDSWAYSNSAAHDMWLGFNEALDMVEAQFKHVGEVRVYPAPGSGNPYVSAAWTEDVPTDKAKLYVREES